MTYLGRNLNNCWPPAAILFAVFMMAGASSVRAQLTVDNSFSATDLANALIGSGVTISAVTSTCNVQAMGKFDATGTVLPIDSGIILASGPITNAIGPNNGGGTGLDLLEPGDPDLNAIPGIVGTNDACVLEFDIEVSADTIKFNYIFGSEEYPEFAPPSFSTFNDVFAFWISGPGITGAFNMARVPGSTIPVSIDNVNAVTNVAYYVDNGDGFTAPFSTDPSYIQYDGQTVLLEAKAAVQPCETYHLKLAVADDGDGVWDSGVMIEAGSLVSTGVSLSASTSVGFGFDDAIEGCVDGIIDLIPDVVPTDSVVVPIVIGGTALNGVDYTTIADSVVFAPGDTINTLTIVPTVDGLPEGPETVVIYVLDPCLGAPYDSVTITILDEIVLDVTVDPTTTICPNDTVQLYVTGGVGYEWTPPWFVSNDTIDNPLGWPNTSTWFTAYTQVGTCEKEDSVFVDVSPGPMPDAGPDIDLCLGTTAMLDGSGMGTYQWTPPAGLDNPTIATPITSVTTNTIYVLAVTDAAGCTDYDTVDVRVITPPVADVLPTDLFVCPNEEIQLMATGGVSYSWMPTDGLDDPFIADPLLTATIGGTYDVIVYDASGCSDTASVNVVLDALPDVDAGDQQIIDLGTTITLNGFTDGVDFSWSPDEFLSDATVLNPDAFPETTTWFVLEATSEAGCLFADSVRIIVVEPPSIIIPNAFTPNGDGLHDILSPVATRDVEDEAHFRIYNRWGELVYESFDVNSGWDGTVNGKPQEIGSYVYIFVGTNPRGEQYTLNGTITLLR